jgi:hypothetical protein
MSAMGQKADMLASHRVSPLSANSGRGSSSEIDLRWMENLVGNLDGESSGNRLRREGP